MVHDKLTQPPADGDLVNYEVFDFEAFYLSAEAAKIMADSYAEYDARHRHFFPLWIRQLWTKVIAFGNRTLFN